MLEFGPITFSDDNLWTLRKQEIQTTGRPIIFELVYICEGHANE